MRILLLVWSWVFHWFRHAAAVLGPRFVIGLIALVNVACGATIPAHEPNVQPKRRFGICTHDPDIELNSTSWAYPNDRPPAVSNLHPYEYNRAILSSGFEFYFDPFAPASSVKFLPIALSTLPCDRMHTVELRPLDRNECSGDVCALAWPAEFELPNGGFCHIGKTASSSPPSRGNWFGQTEQLAIRSTYFCNTEPLTPKNAPTRILDKQAERAWLEGYWYGYRVSVLLTQAEADIQAFVNKSDHWIVALFKRDPGSVDAIMQRTAAMLDEIPEQPQYDTRHEAFYANDGYAAGARRGAADVEATLSFIEAGATIAEVALMHVVMGPLGGANALRAVLMRLRNIPVFVPGAAGGLGGFVRLAKAAPVAKIWSSERLAKALRLAGKVRGEGQEAHHIVAGGHEWAQKARDTLTRVGIKLDDAVNGVFLPATKNSPNPLKSIVHRTLSNNKAYYDKVNEALEGLTSRKAVEVKLKEIAQQLIDGTYL